MQVQLQKSVFNGNVNIPTSRNRDLGLQIARNVVFTAPFIIGTKTKHIHVRILARTFMYTFVTIGAERYVCENHYLPYCCWFKYIVSLLLT